MIARLVLFKVFVDFDIPIKLYFFPLRAVFIMSRPQQQNTN
jgi:hypothetical protein